MENGWNKVFDQARRMSSRAQVEGLALDGSMAASPMEIGSTENISGGALQILSSVSFYFLSGVGNMIIGWKWG